MRPRTACLEEQEKKEQKKHFKIVLDPFSQYNSE